tara:strand:+ start:24 stop:674 length:651 start_codon:yes stop_codon:yes gene_type:complete
MIRAIGFDFDGTLIMSEGKKSIEMAKVFREKFGVKRGVKSAYEKLRGKNRKRKVELLFEKFMKRKPTKKELKQVADHFGKHYEKSMDKCPFFKCTNIIKELKSQVKFLFLLSLEGKKEVKKVAKHCGIAKYFDEIMGGPKSKTENLQHVLKRHHVKPSETIYIGDSHSDVIVSKKLKVKVVLLGKKHTYKKLKEDLEADFVFSSLCDVPHKLDGFT